MSAYGWLTRDVWTRTWRRAYLFALKLKHPPHEAEDFVQAAVTDALDPAAKPWVPGAKPDFASHVCNLVYSAHGNHVQSYEVLNARVPLTHSALRGEAAPGDPEEALMAKGEDELAAARYDALLERTEADTLVSLLLEDGEGETSTERAVTAGHSLDDIKFARQRLKRHIQAVVRALPSPEDPDGEKGGDSR